MNTSDRVSGTTLHLLDPRGRLLARSEVLRTVPRAPHPSLEALLATLRGAARVEAGVLDAGANDPPGAIIPPGCTRRPRVLATVEDVGQGHAGTPARERTRPELPA